MRTITIDLELIEHRIALHTFCENFAVVDELRSLVLECFTEVSEHRIELEIDEIRREREGRGSDS